MALVALACTGVLARGAESSTPRRGAIGICTVPTSHKVYPNHAVNTGIFRIALISAGLSGALAAVACRPAPALEPAQVDGFSDDFEGSGVSADWQVVNAETFALSVEGGQLVMVPNRNTVWYMADEGPGVFRDVTGNFRVTTTTYARKASNNDEAVDTGYQFSGIIARNPAGATERENYVFNVVGWRGDYMAAETKTTRNDESVVHGPDWESGDAELRICRFNGTFMLADRPVGGDTWNHSITYERRDLPETLQVGPIAYTYTDEWDLRAAFDQVVYEPLASLDDCLSE